MAKPLISIITVVYNAVDTLEHTIQSIVNQTYSNIEYVIIDGGSTDGSLAIAGKYRDQIDTFVSEKDKGIYDAMNKGVKASKGDWILFINADDYLLEDSTIEKCIPYLENCPNLVAYGDIIYLYPNEPELKYGKDWDSLKGRFRNVAMSLGHQATFHARKLFEKRLFDISFKVTGDYDLLLGHLKDHDATYFPVTVAKMRMEGISSKGSKILLLKETRRAQINNQLYRYIPTVGYVKNAVKLLVVNTIIRVIGVSGKNKIKSLFR